MIRITLMLRLLVMFSWGIFELGALSDRYTEPRGVGMSYHVMMRLTIPDVLHRVGRLGLIERMSQLVCSSLFIHTRLFPQDTNILSALS